MPRALITVVVAIAIMFGTVRSFAHERFRVIGTIAKQTKATITVKKKDAKTTSIHLDKQTEISRDGKRVEALELKVGRSVVVDAYGDSEDDLLAVEIRIVPDLRHDDASDRR